MKIPRKRDIEIQINGEHYSIGRQGEERISMPILQLKRIFSRIGYTMWVSDGENPMTLVFTAKHKAVR
jgi:hypothetical protein